MSKSVKYAYKSYSAFVRRHPLIALSLLTLVMIVSVVFTFAFPQNAFAHATASDGTIPGSPHPDPQATNTVCEKRLPGFPLPSDIDKQKNIPTIGASDNSFLIATREDLTICQEAVGGLWNWSLGVVDVFIVLAVSLNGLKMMLSGSAFRYADAIESLPGILLALLAAHFSFTLVWIFLRLNNTISIELYNLANKAPWSTFPQPPNKDTTACWADKVLDDIAGGNPVSAFTAGITTWLMKQIDCNWIGSPDWSYLIQAQAANSGQDITQTGTGLSFVGMAAAFKSVTNFLGFTSGILGLLLIGQIMLRLLLLNFFIVFSPIGIGCWALPGRAGQPLTRIWFKGFLSTLFSQLVQVMALIIIRATNGPIIGGLYGLLVASDPKLQGDETLLLVAVIAQLWFVIRIPTLLGAGPMSMTIEIGSKIAQAAQGVVSQNIMVAQTVIGLASNAGSVGFGAMIGR